MDRHLVRGFPPTRHSAVAAVRDGDAEERGRALDTLAAVYWQPVYTYLRLRWRRPHEEAADLAVRAVARAAGDLPPRLHRRPRREPRPGGVPAETRRRERFLRAFRDRR